MKLPRKHYGIGSYGVTESSMSLGFARVVNTTGGTRVNGCAAAVPWHNNRHLCPAYNPHPDDAVSRFAAKAFTGGDNGVYSPGEQGLHRHTHANGFKNRRGATYHEVTSI